MTAVGGQALGLAGMVVLLAVVGEQMPAPVALAWGVIGGCAGVLGLAAFYAALARGSMSLVAPLAALIGAAVPVVVGVLGGERLGPLQTVGVVVALGAVVLISRSPGGAGGDVRDLPLVLVAGFGFAGFFLAMDRSAAEGGATWWPILSARVGGLAVLGAMIAVTRPRFAISARALPLVAVAGVGDLGGNLFFLLANAAGELSLAAVLSSLYPVTTVGLAFVLLRERLSRGQLVGVALALLAIALVAA